MIPVPSIRRCLLGAAFAAAGLSGGPAQAQILLDVMGASAIQNSLQSLPAGGASGVIERSRSTVDQARRAEQERLDLLQQMGGGGRTPAPPGAAAALMAPLLMQMVGAMGLPGGPGAAAGQPFTTAVVNGQLIPYCSHGGLCQGALMRAVRSR